MSNPLSHVGQTARPESPAATPPSADAQAGDAGTKTPPGHQQDDSSGKTLEQHPRTTPMAPTQPATPPTGPRGAHKEIKDLEPGEPPPESSAGS